jgi:hypothetical protein
MHAARSDILEINAQLCDIEQVMIYSARVHNGTLADAALDLILTIRGQPDDAEKLYAYNITMDLINQEKDRAMALLDRRDALKHMVEREQINIDNDLAKLEKIEGKYEYASSLISSCIIAGGTIIIAILVFKFLL